MAWTYADFETYTGAERIQRLKAHIAEVEAAIGPDVASDGKSRGNSPLNAKLERLYRRLDQLENGPGNMTAGGFGKIRRR